MVVLVDEPSKSTEFLGQNRSKEKKFVFDQALGPDSTQVRLLYLSYNTIHHATRIYEIIYFEKVHFAFALLALL